MLLNEMQPFIERIQGAVLAFLIVVVTAHMSIAQEAAPKTSYERGWKAIRDQRYAEAERLFRVAVKEAESTEEEDVTLAKSLYGLASSLTEQRKYSEAEPLLKRALTLYTKLDGPLSDGVMMAFSQLEQVLQAEGKYDDAAVLFKQMISRTEKESGKNEIELGDYFAYLGILKQSECEFAEAELWFKRSLANTEYNVSKRKITEASLGTPFANLAAVNLHRGRYADAETLYKKALLLLETRRQQSFPQIAETLSHMSELYLIREKFELAVKYRRRSIDIYEAEFPAWHYTLAEQRRKLAIILEIQGNEEEASQLDDNAMKWLRFRPRWGVVPVAAAQPALRKAAKSFEGGDFVGAEHSLRIAIGFHEQTLGPEGGEVGKLYDEFANALEKQERTKESAVYRRRAERIRLIHKDGAARDGTAVGENPIPVKTREYFERAEALRVNRVNTLQGKIDGLKNGMANERGKFKAQNLKQLSVWEKSRDELRSLRIPTAPLPLPIDVGDIGFQEDLVDVFIWDSRTITAKMHTLESAKRNSRDILRFQVKSEAELGDGWEVKNEASQEFIVANVDTALISKSPRISVWPVKIMLRVVAEKPDAELLKRFPEERRKRIQDLVVLESVENPSEVEKYRKVFY